MRPCPSCGGDCGHTKKKGCQYKSPNEFNPDWDGFKDMVEEIQRLAKRVEELETKKWVGLTDEEIEKIYMDTMNFQKMGRALEDKLKERNT